MTTAEIEKKMEKLTGEISKLKSRCTKLEKKLGLKPGEEPKEDSKEDSKA